jgi:hypothetical protein
MKSQPGRALFAPGNITCSQAALEAMQAAGTTGLSLIARHITGDWPDDEQRMANRAILESRDDLPLISHFRFPGDIEIIVTTMYPRTPSLRWTDVCLAEEEVNDDELFPEDQDENLDLFAEAALILAEQPDPAAPQPEGVE